MRIDPVLAMTLLLFAEDAARPLVARYTAMWQILEPHLRAALADEFLKTSITIAVAQGHAQRRLLSIGDAVAAPISISFSAAKPIVSRSESASGGFSTSVRRFIMASVIGDLSGSGWCRQSDLTGKPR